MSEIKKPSITVGQWRQAITSFGILYPEGEYDWGNRPGDSDPSQVEAAAHPSRFVDSLSEPYYATHVQLTELPDNTQQSVAALIQIRILRRKNNRLGTVNTWVTTDVERVLSTDFDNEDFKRSSEYQTKAFLDLDLPNLPRFANVPAKTPALDFMLNIGLGKDRSEQRSVNASKVAQIVTALTCKSSDIPCIFEPK